MIASLFFNSLSLFFYYRREGSHLSNRREASNLCRCERGNASIRQLGDTQSQMLLLGSKQVYYICRECVHPNEKYVAVAL